MDLKEAYRLVLADLEQHEEVEKMRKRAAALLSRQNAQAELDEVVDAIRGKKPEEFKYVNVLMRDAAKDVITKAGGPVESSALLAALKAGGYSDATTKTLHASMGRGVQRGIFVTVEKHVWDLASRYPELAPANPTSRSDTASPSSGAH